MNLLIFIFSPLVLVLIVASKPPTTHPSPQQFAWCLINDVVQSVFIPVVHQDIRLPYSGWRHPDIFHLSVLSLVPYQITVVPFLTTKYLEFLTKLYFLRFSQKKYININLTTGLYRFFTLISKFCPVAIYIFEQFGLAAITRSCLLNL